MNLAEEVLSLIGEEEEKWIQGAIEKEGALTDTARREGALTDDGTIKVDWLRKKAAGDGKTAKRARLALTLRGLNK